MVDHPEFFYPHLVFVSFPYFQGVYLILDERWGEKLCLRDLLLQAAACGVHLFQYRNKEESMRMAFFHGLPIRQAAREANVTFLVNDRCDLALALEAEGVHLGQEDMPLSLARSVMGKKALIGISTHTLDQVKAAAEGGADYVGYGPIFPTLTKTDHEPIVGVEGLRLVRNGTDLPIFAIGGISIESVPTLISAGADGVAVASAILDAPNTSKAIQEFLTPFAKS